MIGKLKGIVDSFGEDFVILDVSGVGYIAHCSARTLQRMPKAGEPAELSIETHVREDMIRLYGFRSDAEREWFRLLQTVQGVGARVALGVLSALEPEALANAIATGDKTAISRAPGVGPRLAARMAAELKDKAPAFAPVDPSLIALTDAVGAGAAPQPVADAISALVNLGYPQVQAATAVAAALKSAGEEAEARVLIRLGLRELAR
ncbi:Holliday junction DNA helicase RuvA [Methylobacterium sp. OAE515]|jgi:Holliday junction DNA helicase RuvA|uniref:Holliday junction branch migration protein RuvA n=1 Tax=Methylobacterium sp. OAE515 TaxID=2817895 RepID=UPI00178BEF10